MSMKSDMSMEQPGQLQDKPKSTHLRYNISVRHTVHTERQPTQLIMQAERNYSNIHLSKSINQSNSESSSNSVVHTITVIRL